MKWKNKTMGARHSRPAPPAPVVPVPTQDHLIQLHGLLLLLFNPFDDVVVSIDKLEQIRNTVDQVFSLASTPPKARKMDLEQLIYNQSYTPEHYQLCCDAIKAELMLGHLKIEEQEMNSIIHTLGNWKTASDEDVESCKRNLAIVCGLKQIERMYPTTFPWHEYSSMTHTFFFVQVTRPEPILLELSKHRRSKYWSSQW